MSFLLHPRIIASWGTAKWLVGWIVPLIWASAVYQCLRQSIIPAGAMLLAALTFAAVIGFTVLYVERFMPPEDLSEGGALAVMVLWTIPVDVACAVIPLLPHLGLTAAGVLWLVVCLVCGTVTALSRLGVFTLPGWFPSPAALAVAGVAVGVTLDRLLDGGGVPAAVILGLLIVLAVVVAAGTLDGGRPVVDIDAEITRVGLDAFVHRCRLVDGPCPTPGHPAELPQALYAVPREYGAVRLAHVVNGSINPATGKYEYRYLKVPASCRTIRDAVAWSYAVPAAAYVPERRT